MSNILVIGMVDSIHIARWLEQFESTEHKIIVAPSRRFKRINPELLALARRSRNIEISGVGRASSISGYIDFLIFEVFGTFLRSNLRARFIHKIIHGGDLHIIHAIEMQSAGYLLLELHHSIPKDKVIMFTNWGSDLFFYQHDKYHLNKIKSVLKKIDVYAAECTRDYELARKLGFTGKFLPTIPNAGGFLINSRLGTPASQRNLILVKGSGDKFGNINLLLPLLSEVLQRFTKINLVFYSTTPDSQLIIQEMAELNPHRVLSIPTSQKLTHDEMLNLFSRARIYVSSSLSDGISTSFLEALISGSYPIQSDTSCAKEWIGKGFLGSVLPNDAKLYRNHLIEALESDDLVDRAQRQNYELSKKFLAKSHITSISKKFYDIEYVSNLPTTVSEV